MPNIPVDIHDGGGYDCDGSTGVRAIRLARRCHCAPDLLSELQRAGVPVRGLLGITHNTGISLLVPIYGSR
eukprot:11309918-Prorocentrum_lima.AAC.1